jgi:hypothetical protein
VAVLEETRLELLLPAPSAALALPRNTQLSAHAALPTTTSATAAAALPLLLLLLLLLLPPLALYC